MKKVYSYLALLSLFLFASLSLNAQQRDEDSRGSGELSSARDVEPAMHVHWARGHEAHANGGNRFNSANMSYHGGPIMQNTVVEPIFWGTTWPTYTGDKISGMDLWYSGINGTEYARTTDEYTQSNGARVTSSIAYTSRTYVVDGTAAPSGAPATDAEVRRVVLAGKGLMPSFAGRFTEEQMRDLVAYLHTGLR